MRRQILSRQEVYPYRLAHRLTCRSSSAAVEADVNHLGGVRAVINQLL